MRVIKVKEGLFKDTIVLKTDEFEECYVGSLMGLRNYFANKGTKIKIKVPKRWCVEVDDEYNLDSLVLYCGGLSDAFSWCWA